MGEFSDIEWTHHTFNPWEGCEKVSPGCKNCYAWRRDQWLHKGAHWGPEGSRKFHSERYWEQLKEWNRKAAAAGEQRRVFCGSLCDILDDWKSMDARTLDPERTRLFGEIEATPHLLYLLLTKRPENWQTLPHEWTFQGQWPANAMFGFTAENQHYLDARRQHWKLMQRYTGSRMRTFLSLEPLLGPIELGSGFEKFIHWVIAGGESGPGARPVETEWIRSIRNQCAAAGVPFLFKQWGGVKKKTTGRLLDGVVHDQFPILR